MSGREFWFALASVDGVGPMRIKRLLNRFGTIEAVFDADLSEIARIPLFNPLLAARILKAGIRIAEFRRHIRWFKSRGIEILCLEDDSYPEQLKKIPNTVKNGHLVTVTLKDGRKVENVFVAKRSELLGVYDQNELTFAASDIVSLEPANLTHPPDFTQKSWLRLDGNAA